MKQLERHVLLADHKVARKRFSRFHNILLVEYSLHQSIIVSNIYQIEVRCIIGHKTPFLGYHIMRI